MPVPLGASLSEPKFVFVQIVHAAALFHFILGVVRLLLGVFWLVFLDSSAATVPLATALSVCFHVPLRSLFEVTVPDVSDNSAMRFFFMHVVAAFVFSHFLALTIQRRKFALDFVLTLYVIYFVACCVVGRRVTGGGFVWWAAVFAGVGVMYGATTALCRRRELQDIFFPIPSGAVSVAGNVTDGGSSNAHNGGGGDVMMTTLSVAAEPVAVDAEVRSFSNGCGSPRLAGETAVTGPGGANKRRR